MERPLEGLIPFLVDVYAPIMLWQSLWKKIKWQGRYDWGTGEIRPFYIDINAIYGEHPLKHFDLKHTVFDIAKYSNSANTNL